jgi:hypothetical protein
VFAVQALADIYVIEYESYKWNPCSGNACLAIMCPPDGCHADGKYIVCKDELCVTNILDKNGEEHLSGIWRIDYRNKTSEKLKYQKKYKLESSLSSETQYGNSKTLSIITNGTEYLLMDKNGVLK